MKDRKTAQYLLRYGVAQGRNLLAASIEGIDQAVVIPALAERRSLFRTLASIAQNPPNDLNRTLVICVVNNHRPPLSREEQILDNQETLSILRSIVFSKTDSCRACPVQDMDEIEMIERSELRLAYIDASSRGFEIPDRDGGVGTARKIGMDAALSIIASSGKANGSICCLDADTLVEENYLSAIQTHFCHTDNPGAVTAYAHQRTADPELQAAICCYEIYLRSYVLGLAYAGSPYAYHSIGSTMACSTDGYRSVRGMNRREAAEDFHFLNKLSKTGVIGTIEQTTVFPSPRLSGRVPFGTGQRMRRFVNGQASEYLIHSPESFKILKEWLALMRRDRGNSDAGDLLNEAGRIHVCLENYLRLCRFEATWRLIQKNSRDESQLLRQFHVWFDGLKTLRLIHCLDRTSFPPVPMFTGLRGLLGQMGATGIGFACQEHGVPDVDAQLRIVQRLRSVFPGS